MELHRLHHLADHAVAQNHHRVPVHICNVKSLHDHIRRLLNGGRCQDYQMIIPVAAALGGLEIVALGGLDAAEPGARADDIYNNAGKLRARDITDSLLLQADARAGRGRHHAGAGARRAIDHIDGRHFTLCL